MVMVPVACRLLVCQGRTRQSVLPATSRRIALGSWEGCSVGSLLTLPGRAPAGPTAWSIWCSWFFATVACCDFHTASRCSSSPVVATHEGLQKHNQLFFVIASTIKSKAKSSRRWWTAGVPCPQLTHRLCGLPLKF